LREELRLRMFENRVLRKIFGPKRDDVTGEWRRLHNEELNDLYCSLSIVRVIKSRITKSAGHVARMRERRGVYGVLVVKPELNRSLGISRRRWEDNIKMDLQLRWIFRKWDVREWTGSSWLRIEDRWRALVNAVMNLQVL
jgi:hypothetical protein